MAKKAKSQEESGVLRQYEHMKAKHPDAILLFRIGDFYETLREDAHKAKDILNLTVSSGKINGVRTDIAGFPHHALDTYLPKLVRAGQRVVICEQLENPKQKKVEKESITNSTDMPRKKKEEAPSQEQPKAKAETKTETKTEAKVEAKAEQKSETQQERKPREPQMVTVNGDKVSHGHAFQGKDTQDWYFTAKINGEQLKPQKMDPADLAAYQKKEMTVPQLMERYYPTKLMPKVPEEAYKYPNGIAGPSGPLTVDKFNVYKEKDEKRADYGQYKFYAKVGDEQMSVVASRKDLNAYFDRVMTPGQLVEKNFGERLHLPSHYQQFELPQGVDPKGIRIAKDRSDGKWKVSVDMGDKGKTDKKEISFDDGYSLYKTKSATREQIAAKYLGDDLNKILNAPAVKMEKSASVKM